MKFIPKKEANNNEINNNCKKKKKKEAKNKKIRVKSMINIKNLNDTSYDLFDEIFYDLTFKDTEGKKVSFNCYKDFYKFQLKLNSKYKPDINFFDYKNELNIDILKEIPYKATRLRTIEKEDGTISISPNGHFVRTLKIENKSSSTLNHYKTVIGNSLILKGIYYYEIKILELGEDTDMFFGIIGKNSEFFNNYNNYKNYPFCEFEDCYGFNLNNIYYKKNKRMISVGTVISIRINLTKKKLFIYFDGKKADNNSIDIYNATLGYYPAFSVSSGKEIQVKFGGIYNLYKYFKTGNKID